MADNKPDNIYCDRRPMTRKEIKFFGTAISFDEEMAAAMAAKGIITTPKFLRTQSSASMLSPKTGRKFFRGRDKNSNYDYGSASVGATPKSSYENLSNRSRSTAKCGSGAAIASGRQMLGTLKLVQESTEVDNCAEDNDSVFVGIQRNEKKHRLIQMRMIRLRSRSASTDSWDDPNDRR